MQELGLVAINIRQGHTIHKLEDPIIGGLHVGQGKVPIDGVSSSFSLSCLEIKIASRDDETDSGGRITQGLDQRQKTARDSKKLLALGSIEVGRCLKSLALNIVEDFHSNHKEFPNC